MCRYLARLLALALLITQPAKADDIVYRGLLKSALQALGRACAKTDVKIDIYAALVGSVAFDGDTVATLDRAIRSLETQHGLLADMPLAEAIAALRDYLASLK